MEQKATKQHAHDLIDRMAPGQVSVVVGLLEIMLDPLARTLANAPLDDEPESEDRRSVAASITHAEQGIRHEEVLAEFGLSQEDFESLGRTPLPPDSTIRVDRDA